MVLQNNLQTVRALNAIMIDNSSISTIACLRSNGVTVSDTSRSALLTLLDNLFDTNKPKWVAIVKCFQYDPNANNYTTDANFQQDLRDTYAFQTKTPSNTRLDLKSIFNSIGDFIGGSSTTGGGTKTTTIEPAIKTGAVILIVLVVVGVIVWLSIKK